MIFFKSKIIFLLPVIILAIIALYHSSKLLASSVIAVFPKNAIEHWSCLGRVSDNDLWAEQKKLLQISIDLSRLDSGLLVDMGRMHDLKAMSFPVWKKEAKQNRSLAIEYYRQAIEKKSTWALPWINLAQSKILKSEIDEEAFMAIRRTLVFGKWQSEVQQKLIWLTVGIWGSVPQDIKQYIRSLVKKNLTNKKLAVPTILTSFRFSWQTELKRLVEDEEQLALIRKLEQDEQLLSNMFVNENKMREC